MSVNTKKVEGRRTVRYESFDDLLADAERVATGEHTTIGNWNVGQILAHIAKALHLSIDGIDISVPAPVRWLASKLFKRRFLTKPLIAGFKFPEQLKPQLEFPVDTAPQAALVELREAVARVRRETRRAANPMLGEMTPDESDAFQLRHAEMHMSFIVN